MNSMCGRPARPRGPGAQKAQAWKTPPGGVPEREDPRVKCKDCCAFGHRARNLRCPIRRCQGALVLQPLGHLKGKENMPPRCVPAPTKGPEVPKAFAPRLMPRRESLPQRRPTTQDQKTQAIAKDGKESWEYVRQPCRARPGHIPEGPVQAHESPRGPHRTHPEQSFETGTGTSLSQRSLSLSRSPAWGAVCTLAPISKPQALIQFGALSSSDGAGGKRVASVPADAAHSSSKKRRLGPCPQPQRSSLGTGMSRGHGEDSTAPGTDHAAQTPVPALAQENGQQDVKAPIVGSRPQACSPCGHGGTVCPETPPPPPEAPDSGRPITMVFRRLPGNQWNCALLAAPETPADSPPTVSPTPRPFSVLYEDLLVSSSSDESEED